MSKKQLPFPKIQRIFVETDRNVKFKMLFLEDGFQYYSQYHPWNGYNPLLLGQRLKALAFTLFKPLCS